MSLYIFAAMEMEARPVRSMATHNDLVVVVVGMGPKNARSHAQGVLTASSGHKPDAALVIGLCGGLTPSLPERRIVAYTNCLTTETARTSVPCSPTIVDTVGETLACSGITCDRVIGISASRFAATPAARTALAQSGASVVDMESYSILDVAAANGVPAAVLRVVSDGFDRTFPDFNRALNENGGIDGSKALRIALASPLSVGKLIAANRRAMKSLGEALQVVLKNGCFAKAAGL